MSIALHQVPIRSAPLTVARGRNEPNELGRLAFEGASMSAAYAGRPRSAVFITEELSGRAARKADHLQEKQALQALAGRMADGPADLLPCLVSLAMEMTDGVSAGLSLYEPDPEPGLFRWRHVRGLLAPFDGTTTPRDFSPCGVMLDRGAPVLCRHPELFYDWIAAASIVVPEVILVPLYTGRNSPVGTLWIVSENAGHFDSGDARALTELASFAGIALRMIHSEERLQHALEEEEILAQEMSHRLKNLFTVVSGMIALSAGDTQTEAAMVEVLSGRLHALANAQFLVRHDFRDGATPPRSASLDAVIRTVLKPYELRGNVSRFSIQGPHLDCGDHSINAIALLVNELATNALKYGALKDAGGQVAIHWRINSAKVILTWTETGGAALDSIPTAVGYGTGLAQRTVAGQFGGTLAYDWLSTGVEITTTLAADALLT